LSAEGFRIVGVDAQAFQIPDDPREHELLFLMVSGFIVSLGPAALRSAA
jgi:hypothetical protein